MIDVLQPLEVGAGDATAVYQEIRRDDDSASGQNLLSAERRWSIGTFKNHLALKTASVFLVD